MGNQELKKNVPIYFYYLSIAKQKDSDDKSTYDINQICVAFTNLLNYIIEQDLNTRKFNNRAAEKMIWLDSFTDLNDGNFNITFKSAKYNQARTEIDTDTMTELGIRKQRQDGDEEKTHLCIRLAKGQTQFLSVHESNHYGISISCIVEYINSKFNEYNENGTDKYHYSVSYKIMPGDDFMQAIKKSRTIRNIRLVVDRDNSKDDFVKFAGRGEISDEVEIVLKRPKGAKKFPENLIKAYYDDMQSNNKIKRIYASGTDKFGGPMNLDTGLIKMKHYLSVKTLSPTNEVDSNDFFNNAQEFINETRRK